jgi:protein-tyrosine phosphatase
MLSVVDLHSHLLPGIDDGPRDVADSLRLAREMAAQGVQTVAATPHCRHDHPGVVPAELADRCERLNVDLRAADIALEVLPAGEVDVVWGLEASDRDLRRVSYGQRGETLLVETPYGPLPTAFEELLFRLSMKGYRLLLAHPERNPTFQSSGERLAELVRRGVLVQLTAASLARPTKGSRSATAARRFATEGLAHVIASDAHGGAAPDRTSLLDGALAASELIGAPRARWMVQEAPAAIVAAEPLPPPPPIELRKRSLLGRLGRS